MNKFSKFPAEVVCELHPLFKGLLWVSAARSNDGCRPSLCHVCVQKEDEIYTLVATDGRRMHIHTFDAGLFDTDIDGLEPGLYEVVATKPKFIVVAKSDELTLRAYPDWRKVVPDYTPEQMDNFDARTISKMGIRTGVLLASDFANDAIGFGHGFKKDDCVCVTYGSSGHGEAFIIQHEIGKAIVMPMKLDGDEEKDAEPGAEPAPEPETEADATPDLTGFVEMMEALKEEVPPPTVGSDTNPKAKKNRVRTAKESPTKEAAAGFVEGTKNAIKRGAMKSVTVTAGGKGVKIDANGVHPVDPAKAEDPPAEREPLDILKDAMEPGDQMVVTAGGEKVIDFTKGKETPADEQ